MSSEIIEVKNFSKIFGKTLVVNNLSFTVKKGEIFAFLGANGSGKTTTIRSLLRTYEPSSGHLLVNGKPYTADMSHMLGYLPEERGLYSDSRAGEILAYFGRLKGLSKEGAKRKANDYLNRVNLEDKANVLVKKLSSGQQQKIQLGVATINDPALLILDEPTKGLDPLNRALLMDRLEELHHQGSTILYTTHQLEEIERLKTDRVLIIKNGKKAELDTPTKLKEKYGVSSLDDVFLKVYKS